MNSETKKLALKHAQYLKDLDDVFGELAMYSFHLENMHSHTIKLLQEAEK